MFRVLSLAAGSMAALTALAGPAVARKVTYEVDGQVYSYSTNNNAQTAAARRHIEAAKAAADAKAKAAAERASNPLAAVFGSPAQRAAAEAQAALDRARPGQPTGAAPAATSPEAEPVTTASVNRAVARDPVERSAPRRPTRERADEAEDRPAAPAAPAPRIKAVSYDAASGIKTTFMTDGTVHEEPFEASALPAQNPAPEPASLNAFVDMVRKPSENAGSRAVTQATP